MSQVPSFTLNIELELQSAERSKNSINLCKVWIYKEKANLSWKVENCDDKMNDTFWELLSVSCHCKKHHVLFGTEVILFSPPGIIRLPKSAERSVLLLFYKL
jgi:hypothetical protein